DGAVAATGMAARARPDGGRGGRAPAGGFILDSGAVRSAEERHSLIRIDAVRRELRGSAIALVMVAATTLVAYVLIQSLDVRRGSVIYLLPVLLAGRHLRLIPALVAAGARAAGAGHFLLP